MKTCPICGAKAVVSARICYECYYNYSDRSTRNVIREETGEKQTLPQICA